MRMYPTHALPGPSRRTVCLPATILRFIAIQLVLGTVLYFVLPAALLAIADHGDAGSVDGSQAGFVIRRVGIAPSMLLAPWIAAIGLLPRIRAELAGSDDAATKNPA